MVGLALAAAGLHGPLALLAVARGASGDAKGGDPTEAAKAGIDAMVGFVGNLTGTRVSGGQAADALQNQLIPNHHLLVAWARTYGALLSAVLTASGKPIQAQDLAAQIEELCRDSGRLEALGRAMPIDWTSTAVTLRSAQAVDTNIFIPLRNSLRTANGNLLISSHGADADRVGCLSIEEIEVAFIQCLLIDPLAKDKFLALQGLYEGRQVASILEAVTQEDKTAALAKLGVANPTQDDFRRFDQATERFVGLMEPLITKLTDSVADLEKMALRAKTATDTLAVAGDNASLVVGRFSKFVDDADSELKRLQDVVESLTGQLGNDGFAKEVSDRIVECLRPLVMHCYQPTGASDSYQPVAPDKYRDMPANPEGFYSGGVATWGDIDKGIDFKRDITDACFTSIGADPAPHAVKVVLIRSRSGEGKTTLMRRLAYELALDGKCVVWLSKPEELHYTAVQDVRARAGLAEEDRLYLFVDRFGNADAEAVKALVENLAVKGARITLVGADLDSRIGERYRELGQNAEFRFFHLVSLSEGEADRLFAKLNGYGLIRGKPYEVRNRLREGKELIVALIEARSGARFGDHIREEVERVRAKYGVSTTQVIVAIAQLHQADEEVDTEVLKRRFPNLDLELLKRRTDGMLFEVENDSVWRTRHKLIAAEIAVLAHATHDAGGDYIGGYAKWLEAYGDSAVPGVRYWLHRLCECDLIEDANELFAASRGMLRDRDAFEALLKFEEWRCNGTAGKAIAVADEVSRHLIPAKGAIVGEYSEAYRTAERMRDVLLVRHAPRSGGEAFLQVAYDLMAPVSDLHAGHLLHEALVFGLKLPRFAAASDQARVSCDHLQRALEIDPSDGFVHQGLGAISINLSMMAEWRWAGCASPRELALRASDCLRIAAEIEPDIPHGAAWAAFLRLAVLSLRHSEDQSSDRDEARSVARAFEVLGTPASYGHASSAWLIAGDLAAARDARNRAITAFGDDLLDVVKVRHALWDAFERDDDESLARLKKLLVKGSRSFTSPLWVFFDTWPKTEDVGWWRLLIEIAGSEREADELDAWPRWRAL